MVPFRNVLAWFQSKKGKAAHRKAANARYRPRVEHLETRNLMAVGVGVRLDFGDGTASNSFHERLLELTNRLGVFPLTTTEEATVKQNLVTGITNLGTQAGFAVTETAPNPYDAPETLFFGKQPAAVGASAGSRFESTLDWRNGNLSTEYVFPSELLQVGVPASTPRSQLLKYVSYALIHASGSAIGAGLGADPATAFGDPSIIDSTFANTFGLPARNLGADASIGFTESQLLTSFGNGYVFRYSPVALAQMQFGEGIRNSVPGSPNQLLNEQAGAHSTPATAQAVTLNLAASGESHTNGAKIGFVGFGKIEGTEKDYYRFTAAAGDLVTIRANSQLAYEGVAFDTMLKLFGTDGTTLLSSNDNTRFDATSFGQSTDPLVSTDSMILNFRIPAAGTYYIEVSSNGGGLAGLAPYDLFIVSWASQATPWQSPSSVGVEDVTNDGFVVPQDALYIINQLNSPGGSRRLANPIIGLEQPVMIYTDINNDGQITDVDKIGVDLTPTLGYVDVNGDGFISPIDALMIINRLNAPPTGSEAEGESSAAANASDLTAGTVNAESTDMVLALLYGGEAGSSLQKRRSS